MKNKKIILAGGTGFIGQEFTKYFGKENNVVIPQKFLKQVSGANILYWKVHYQIL